MPRHSGGRETLPWRSMGGASSTWALRPRCAASSPLPPHPLLPMRRQLIPSSFPLPTPLAPGSPVRPHCTSLARNCRTSGGPSTTQLAAVGLQQVLTRMPLPRPLSLSTARRGMAGQCDWGPRKRSARTRRPCMGSRPSPTSQDGTGHTQHPRQTGGRRDEAAHPAHPGTRPRRCGRRRCRVQRLGPGPGDPWLPAGAAARAPCSNPAVCGRRAWEQGSRRARPGSHEGWLLGLDVRCFVCPNNISCWLHGRVRATSPDVPLPGWKGSCTSPDATHFALQPPPLPLPFPSSPPRPTNQPTKGPPGAPTFGRISKTLRPRVSRTLPCCPSTMSSTSGSSSS